jgi:hypothetical protein
LLRVTLALGGLGRTTWRWGELFDTQDRGTQDRVDMVVWVVSLVFAIDQPAAQGD